MERIQVGVDASAKALGRTLQNAIADAGWLVKERRPDSPFEPSMLVTIPGSAETSARIDSRLNDAYFDPVEGGQSPLAFYPLEVVIEASDTVLDADTAARNCASRLFELIVSRFNWPAIHLSSNGLIVRTHSNAAAQINTAITPAQWREWDNSVEWPPYQVLPD